MIEGLYGGDCRELSKQIPDESVDLIFTDPHIDGTGYDKHGKEEDYFIPKKHFTNTCACEICKRGEIT
ncbi:MAG: hypothetical protein K8R40_02370 [Anaerolineaceae bacterium]|nr:hypothetical protein [Anaerolineaceae bacterium]